MNNSKRAYAILSLGYPNIDDEKLRQYNKDNNDNLTRADLMSCLMSPEFAKQVCDSYDKAMNRITNDLLNLIKEDKKCEHKNK